MELIIKDTWTDEYREDKINEYIITLGKRIYQKCKSSNNLTKDESEKISLNLCTTYAESLVSPYINKISFGSIEILITEKAVRDICNLAQLDNELVESLV